MNNDQSEVQDEVALIQKAQAEGTAATLKTYAKLSGPGWLQSAITLGGGSLAGSLYLGVIGGYELLWLQPIMMILGVLMLSVIGYVTLSTGEKPFQAINKHISPVLGWGWLIAAMLANLVWAMPQFSLGTAALQQNLFPGLLGGGTGKYLAVALLFIAGAVVVWFYDKGGNGIRMFEIILKIMVGIVVLSFFGVVASMAFSEQGLPRWQIIKGFIPNLGLLNHPTEVLQEVIAQSEFQAYWTETIMASQKDIMVTAAATAVGINMTFLLPYSMLRKGWGKTHRGLATFDLSIGLFIPFLLATTCVVIAATSQFHGKYDAGLLDPSQATPATEQLRGSYEKNLAAFLKHQGASNEDFSKQVASTAQVDKEIAAMLVSRDAFQLAAALEKLSGSPRISQIVFGTGVVGMAISTIIILMLINGFCLVELLGAPMSGAVHRVGSMLPAFTGSLGFLLLWGNAEAKFWLAVPTSVFGMVLLPVAYITFFFMMNSKSLLGENLPKGNTRILLNAAMLLAIGAATIGAGWSIWAKTQWVGVGLVVAFVGAAMFHKFAFQPIRVVPASEAQSKKAPDLPQP